MDLLLKIVAGPMNGAEIALVGGTTVSFGSGAEADIVVADSSLAPVAAKLEVTESGVVLHAADGSTQPLEMFTKLSFGDTAIAVGPATGKWEALKEPAAAPAAEPEKTEMTPPPAAEKKHGHPILWTIFWLLVFVLLAGLALWFFRKPIAEKYPEQMKAVSEYAAVTQSYALKAKDWIVDQFREAPPPAPPPMPTLSEIAAEHDLTYADGVLSGNLPRRTERLAIRAMALAVDPAVKFDLTDDETLLTASSELLFACSDGQLSVVSASNRVVVLKGYAPSANALARALHALNDDVKGIEKVDTAKVRVGGQAPAVVEVDGEPAVVASKKVEIPAKARPNYPIAGILTTPYPCVVMRNGMRLVEGAQVGTAVLVKIEAEKLTLKEGGTEFTWEP